MKLKIKPNNITLKIWIIDIFLMSLNLMSHKVNFNVVYYNELGAHNLMILFINFNFDFKLKNVKKIKSKKWKMYCFYEFIMLMAAKC